MAIKENLKLRVVHDQLEAGASITLDPAMRVVYCRTGNVRIIEGGRRRILSEDNAQLVQTETTIEAAVGPATVWRWELVPVESDDAATLAHGAGVVSENKGAYPLPLPDDERQFSIRCDRVAFPPSGEALTHIHAAPGVRCVHTGEFFHDSLGKQWTIKPGVTWLERGPEPVYAKVWDKGPANFIRVMVIPSAYSGKSTISYVKPEDAQKPKSQQYYRYLEEEIQLPG
ncbi:hypothetical protein EDC30_11544 [Paucimonas lemoignei]|uniref:Uncharacterized protein n=1 Tax=Paucimonas lemoignei TaxID=29443 RepID=A0A4R3HPS6_PAULE|nr:hypothetical protein [Paucimonas lemoignei]TCS33754.1 hypothetical protein EDC30_11544 [Paucimonas lemoignei]